MGRSFLFGCVVSMVFGGATAVARPIPGLPGNGSVPDTFDTLVADVQPVDPVILEPIRPLLPVNDPAAAMLVRPESCGAVSPALLGLMFLSLGFMGGAGQRFRSQWCELGAGHHSAASRPQPNTERT